MRVKKNIKKSFITVLAVLCISCATSNNLVQENEKFENEPKQNGLEVEFVNKINNIFTIRNIISDINKLFHGFIYF